MGLHGAVSECSGQAELYALNISWMKDGPEPLTTWTSVLFQIAAGPGCGVAAEYWRTCVGPAGLLHSG